MPTTSSSPSSSLPSTPPPIPMVLRSRAGTADTISSGSLSPTSTSGKQSVSSSSKLEKPRQLGLSALFVLTGDENGIYLYVSASMTEILGYEPRDLVGKSCYLIFHPDEIPQLREVHYQALTDEKVACIAYMRLLHQEGYYVDCAVSYSTVFDRTVGMVTRAVDGPIHIRQAATAREVIEISPSVQGIQLGRWSKCNPTSSPTYTPITVSIDRPWDLPQPSPRTFFLLDRFTETARIMFVSNDVIVNGSSLKNQPFYSIIRPSDRDLVRQWLEAAKIWAPVVYDNDRTGGHGYLSFHVLKIPDLPPAGLRFPQGTDDTERFMPGQEFILVEGIFTASSDGVACIINRKPRLSP